MEIKRLDYISFALVNGIASAILGLIAGILEAVGLSFLPSWYAFGASVTAIVISPIMGFLVGLVSGLIFALLYNLLISKWIKIKAE